jgi:hypothetical protein
VALTVRTSADTVTTRPPAGPRPATKSGFYAHPPPTSRPASPAVSSDRCAIGAAPQRAQSVLAAGAGWPTADRPFDAMLFLRPTLHRSPQIGDREAAAPESRYHTDTQDETTSGVHRRAHRLQKVMSCWLSRYGVMSSWAGFFGEARLMPCMPLYELVEKLLTFGDTSRSEWIFPITSAGYVTSVV